METEHLFKTLLEQPNGLARRILAKAGSNPTDLLDKTDAYIRSQPRVTGDSQQVHLFSVCFPLLLTWEFGLVALPLAGCAQLLLLLVKAQPLWPSLDQATLFRSPAGWTM